MTNRRLVQRLVKATAAAADVVRPPAAGLVILLYHRVGGGSGLEIDLPVELFAEQMAVLSSEAQVVTLDDAVAALRVPHAGGGRPRVAVTFDDGTADFADVALPVLARHRIPATVFVATDFVERARSFPHDGVPLSWGALADAVGTGLVTAGSHTHTHALLDRLAPVDVDQELDRSIELLEDHLGAPARHFAYPKALAGSDAAADSVRRRFVSASLAGTRPNAYGRTDPLRLARSPVQVADGMRWFRHKLRGGMGLEDSLRSVANRRRYAGAAT